MKVRHWIPGRRNGEFLLVEKIKIVSNVLEDETEEVPEGIEVIVKGVVENLQGERVIVKHYCAMIANLQEA